jgi:hypothetical protein
MAEYIAREVLLAQLRAMESYNASPMYRRGYDDCVATVLNAPTADVAPVVHGRWDESKEHFYLNNGCKEWINFYCSECDAPNNSPTDYCPNCGAKMDGGAENG